MATLTIRNLPDEVRDRIRREAAEHGRSMEEEARQALAVRYRPKLSIAEIMKTLDALNASVPPLPPGAKMDVTDSFIAEKRITALYERGAISLEERKNWNGFIDRYEVSLPEVEAFFEEHRAWREKS
ncbi:MAG TPA: Arc family DNA-binding protein [Rhizomicrobium sp.]|jgi:plasmid stability protein|nr:Arc family DNA-binding protein [Rhizomicrobium sp.]